MRALKSDERALWRETMRSVKPLRPVPRTEDDEAPKAAPPPRRATKPRHAAAAAPPKPAGPKMTTALDRRTAQRLKRGTIAIEARLDLHGMTQTEAHAALTRFLTKAQKNGARMVLVITGKSGVLHGAVPRWLAEDAHRHRILAVARAQIQHGGEGALYLMLRRSR